MATVFWDSKSISLLMIGEKISSQYYVDLLDCFIIKLTEMQPYLSKKIFFYQMNALAHLSVITTTKFINLHYELLPHLPYSPGFVTFVF